MSVKEPNPVFQPFPKWQILDASKLKQFTGNNGNSFELDENGSKLSESVESTVEKGKIVHYEQFLFFPQCFQKTCGADTLKQGNFWERVKDTEESGSWKHFEKRRKWW